jgi:hypothetical protein
MEREYSTSGEPESCKKRRKKHIIIVIINETYKFNLSNHH